MNLYVNYTMSREESSLTPIASVSANKITKLYEKLGAKFLYGNFPIFDHYSDNLRLPLAHLRFNSISEALIAAQSMHNLNNDNLTMLNDWLINGEPIACLVHCDLQSNDQPGLPIGPIQLKRTSRIYNIDGQTYEKYPSAPAIVYIAFSDVHL